MIRYLLDTNMCIYLIKQKPPEVIQRLRQCAMSEVGISSITTSELYYGVAKSERIEQNSMALMTFLMPFEILPYETEAAQAYGHIRASLERGGTPIGAQDTFIAAHAYALGVTLVTNNEREFERVDNLRIENWVA